MYDAGLLKAGLYDAAGASDVSWAYVCAARKRIRSSSHESDQRTYEVMSTLKENATADELTVKLRDLSKKQRLLLVDRDTFSNGHGLQSGGNLAIRGFPAESQLSNGTRVDQHGWWSFTFGPWFTASNGCLRLGAKDLRDAVKVYFEEQIAPQLRRGGHNVNFRTFFNTWWHSLTKERKKTGAMGTTTSVSLVEGREWKFTFGHVTLEKN